MRQIYTALTIILISILFGLIAIHAQEDCDVATSDVIKVVEDVCSTLDNNQVCYGNFEVGADVLDNVDVPDFSFENPGDLADLENIKSIYLSALNPEEDTWGIAQMLLLVATSKGTQDLNLILFGDVQVENAVEPTLIVEVQVGVNSANIRNLPAINALILQAVEAGTLLEAVGRLEDNSWVRVRTGTGSVGWIFGELVKPVNDGDMIDELEIQDDLSPYFGPMQAFYFNQGSGSACDNVTADGLIIQTPQGPASVSISINGVNIDLLPGQTGASAFVQGSGANMTIAMMTGYSNISANGTNYYLEAGQQSTIQIGVDGNPIGEPSLPITYDQNMIDTLPPLPFVSPVISVNELEIVDNLSDGTTSVGTTTSGTSSSTGTTTTGGGISGSTPSSCEINTNSEKACGETGNLNGNGGGDGGNGAGGGSSTGNGTSGKNNGK